MKDFPIIRIDNFYDFSKGENTRVKNKVINQIKRAEWDNNYALEKNKFTTKLYNTFVDTAKKNLNFKVNKDLNRDFCWAVASNKDFKPSVNWHNHIKSSTINSVYYLDIPKDMEGGEIEFRSRRKDVLKITPKTNELYIFPCWLWHNPIDVKSKQFRLSINMEIIALEKHWEIFDEDK
tara:strand:+ start:6940 stop:7473 length:534 start_codon:yes stop_codon:yes gene_type:complete